MSGRSVKNRTTEEQMKKELEIRNINSITVFNLIQIQNLDLSEYLLIFYPNLIEFPLYILQNTKKKTIKNVCFGNFSFHWLEIEQINETLIEISKFDLSIEKVV